jgi:hypothetical protein
MLPPDHAGELIELTSEGWSLAGGYWTWMAAIASLWLLGGVGYWALRPRRRRAVAVIAPTAPLTTADRLRPLVERFGETEMSANEKAQLERLLLNHWRDRLELHSLDFAHSIERIREHPEAGALLRALESCLHRPHPEARQRLVELLAPYRAEPGRTANPRPTGSQE